jgi:hypothetical protein
MADNEENTRSNPESTFSFGVRELRAANMARKFELDVAPLKVTDESRGSDPYNSSGSFDRKKNWSRVGKR